MKGDPRRPESIIPFKDCVLNSSEVPPDWFSFLSVMCAMIGFMLRIKWAAWASLLMFISGYTSSRSSTMDYSQIFTSFSMILISLVTNYSFLFRQI
ncbi:hypothetical protein SteCoe_36436 [Stentor coeruleus]|uniref:Protein Asterix n=1 Tax=Stentor coeruleus TaxID=5963 RepID=A0A1R2AQ58_9CILI|nr:hypothetical protein SteCoe_36436 [Stentor coeruleus]